MSGAWRNCLLEEVVRRLFNALRPRAGRGHARTGIGSATLLAGQPGPSAFTVLGMGATRGLGIGAPQRQR